MPDLMTREEMLAALDQERAATLELLPRFSDEQWRTTARDDGWTTHDIATHLADSNYGLALLVLGEVKPSMPLNDRGWMEVDDLNEMRRQKNAALSRDKVLSRMESSFSQGAFPAPAVPSMIRRRAMAGGWIDVSALKLEEPTP